VTLHGWRDRGIIRALLDNSDILLLPSNFEGMPIVAMEALSNGCAVVASRTSGVEDIAGHALARDCFWAYPIGDVNAAAECVMQAAAVSPLARYECALRLAKAEFSIDHCIERYRDLILGLAPLPTAKGEVSAWQRHFSAVISYPVSLWRWGRITAS
jgi:glycosyltransferase involved in cell wall biosynthesis